MRRFLAAAVAATALASPAYAEPTTAPVTGDCTLSLVGTGSELPTPVLTAYATALRPAYEVGVSCWISEGGFGWATASNPGVAAASAGTGRLYDTDVRYCVEVWAHFLDGTWYTSTPVCRG